MRRGFLFQNKIGVAMLASALLLASISSMDARAAEPEGHQHLITGDEHDEDCRQEVLIEGVVTIVGPDHEGFEHHDTKCFKTGLEGYGSTGGMEPGAGSESEGDGLQTGTGSGSSGSGDLDSIRKQSTRTDLLGTADMAEDTDSEGSLTGGIGSGLAGSNGSTGSQNGNDGIRKQGTQAPMMLNSLVSPKGLDSLAGDHGTSLLDGGFEESSDTEGSDWMFDADKLPNTGGRGTWMVLVLGMTGILVGVTVLQAMRRKEDMQY